MDAPHISHFLLLPNKQVYALDLLGFGSSDKPLVDYTMEQVGENDSPPGEGGGERGAAVWLHSSLTRDGPKPVS